MTPGESRTKEGFNDVNTKYTYYPKKANKIKDLSMSFFINDFIREAIDLPECIKLYKKIIPPLDASGSAATEYSKPVSELDIYKKYTNDIQTNEKTILADKYGELFTILNTPDAKDMTLPEFKKKVEKILLFENKLHNFIQYSTIRDFNALFSFTEFSDYFANLIYSRKGNAQQLTEIQTFLYKLIGPLYLHSKWLTHVNTNPTLYSKNDDMLYVLNTTKELISSVKIEDLPHSTKNKNVYVFQSDTANASDTTLTVDSLTIFSILYLLLNAHPLIQPTGNSLIQISNVELATALREYLKKKYSKETGTNSIIAFGLMPENEPTLVNV